MNSYQEQAPNKSVENTDIRYNQNRNTSYGLAGLPIPNSACAPAIMPIPAALQNLDKINEELMQIVGVLRLRLDSILQNLPCDLKKDCDVKEPSYSVANHINTIARKTYAQVQELQEIINRLAL